jgi:sigma-E factor negative regulatory protein RseA
MHEDSTQKISQLLDNELDRNEALILLKKIQSSPDLKNKLNRYEAISQALKTDVFLVPDTDFSAKISEKIRQEPTYLLPQSRDIKISRKILATAASIALVAMIAGLKINKPSEEIKTASAIQTPITLPKPAGDSNYQIEQSSINKQINDYLQAHNSSVYINGQANFQPYTRVTAYNQK